MPRSTPIASLAQHDAVAAQLGLLGRARRLGRDLRRRQLRAPRRAWPTDDDGREHEHPLGARRS